VKSCFRQVVEKVRKKAKVSDMLSRSQRLERRNFKKEFIQIFNDFVNYINTLRNPDEFFMQMAETFLELL
jgi:hypothetical protein